MLRTEAGDESKLLISVDVHQDDQDEQLYRQIGWRNRRRQAASSCTPEKFLRLNNRIFLLLLFCVFFVMITVTHVHEVEQTITVVENDLLFLRVNSFLDTYLRPGDESCLICPDQLRRQCDEYLHNSDDEEERLIVYFITSAPENWENREVIRATWGALPNPRPVFITGYSANIGVMDRVVEEAHLFQDIIVEDFLDAYRNLTLKTAFILKSFLSLCPHAHFLIKTDDDMFLQPRLFQELLAAADLDQLTGNVQVGAIPYRDAASKYYLPLWIYNETLLPTFISGWTYVLPGRRVPDIFEAAFTVPMLNLEDVFFTGLVSGQILNLTMVNDERFRTKSFHGRNVCLYKPYAAYHRLPPKKLLNIWPRVQNLTSEICDSVLMREREKEQESEEKKKAKTDESGVVR